MKHLIDVIEVKPQRDKTLLLVFENNKKKIFDMKPLLSKKPFDAIATEKMFMRARVGLGTVVWPKDIDIDPETLWERSKDI